MRELDTHGELGRERQRETERDRDRDRQRETAVSMGWEPETAPPVSPPSLQQIRSTIGGAYSELNAEEARYAVCARVCVCVCVCVRATLSDSLTL